MRKRTFKVLTLAAVLVLTAVAVNGQSSLVDVKIPFDFVVSNTTFPAGEYSFKTFGPEEQVLAMRGTSGHSAFFYTIFVQPKQGKESRPHLIFSRYADQYFLSSLWPGEGMVGREVYKSVRERELLAKNINSFVEVVVAGTN